MVRINKHKLSRTATESVLREFAQVLGNLDSRQSSNFLHELLGREEQLMIAKRLAALLLLLQGNSSYKIAQTLKLSQSTVARLRNKLAAGAFDKTVVILKKNKRSFAALLNTLDAILHLNGLLPHRVGLDRYRILDR
jgi:DNA-binding CsgD family transcriptional regulator